MAKKFKASVRIGSYTGTSSGMSIDIDDATSGVRIIEIDLDFEQFGHLIGSNMTVDCEGLFYGGELIGKKSEFKSELINRPDVSLRRDEEERKAAEREALAPFEVDGWVGREDDIWNHHNWVRGDNTKVKVGFRRYVDNEQE